MSSVTSSPLTGEDRGEGAEFFCPLTLTLSRQGRENPSSGSFNTRKYFVGLGLIATSIHKVHQYFADYGHQLRKAICMRPAS